jgi:hypothetical protein
LWTAITTFDVLIAYASSFASSSSADVVSASVVDVASSFDGHALTAIAHAARAFARHHGLGVSVFVVWVFSFVEEPSAFSVVTSFVSVLTLSPVSVFVEVCVFVVVVDFGGGVLLAQAVMRIEAPNNRAVRYRVRCMVASCARAGPSREAFLRCAEGAWHGERVRSGDPAHARAGSPRNQSRITASLELRRARA